MKEMSHATRFYLYCSYILGAAVLIFNLLRWQTKDPIMLIIICILASLSMLLKVEAATSRSQFEFTFILYIFTFIHLGIAQATIVILISNLVEYFVNRPPWFIQLFNTVCYIIVINVTALIYTWINPSMSLKTSLGIIAILVSILAFTLLNHLLVGIIIWMARGENFKKSGVFDLFVLIIDLTLLSLGAILVLIWDTSPFALILFLFPIYLIYGTLRVPALERQTEIDQKTGLYNHSYFTNHLKNELTRANRFDRPLTIIMADLDLLRNINNTYGHLAGDEVLIGVANILKQSVREYDVVARFGGEEFTILMPETELERGYERAEIIRHAVESAEFIVSTSVTPIKVTISLGVADREYFDQTSENIIHNADTALYHSKLKGRNRSFAYAENAYMDFSSSQKFVREPLDESVNGFRLPIIDEPVSEYQAANVKMAIPYSPVEEEPAVEQTSPPATPKSKASNTSVYAYIGGLFTISILAFGGLYLFAPSLYSNLSIQSWLGLGGCALLVIITEWSSIDLYTKQTSLSTSAVPILAGTLLFGPIGALILSIVYGLITGIKHHSPFNRYIFNFSNQLIAGLLYTTIIFLTGKSYISHPNMIQILLATMAIVIVFMLNSAFISIGMFLESRNPIFPFWREHYSWLLPIYIGMGIVAAAFVFGYKHDPIFGSLLVIMPLLLLRISQVQYVERTKTMVKELRNKNTELEKYSDEISKLNDGLLDTLAEIIDLNDPSVLGHSRKVTDFAAQLAKRLGLNNKQVELIRKGSLLHDIGKLGIPQNILSKPDTLSAKEYETVRTHPNLGASLLAKSPYLRSFIPIVSQHHEFFNGEGYPDKIVGTQISIEARIVSIADAIEAMSSDRPYRKARTSDEIIEELQRCAKTQFDPQVVEAAIEILKEMEINKRVNNVNAVSEIGKQNSLTQTRFS